MYYSSEFKQRCKEVYPHWARLHVALDAGSEIAGRYLDDGRQTGISTSKILLATSLESLQDEAREVNKRAALYAEWHDQYRQDHGLDDGKDTQDYVSVG
jgi:hypothetical protein